jgi:hypothetical protein
MELQCSIELHLHALLNGCDTPATLPRHRIVTCWKKSEIHNKESVQKSNILP